MDADLTWTFSKKSFNKAKPWIVLALFLFIAAYGWYDWQKIDQETMLVYTQKIGEGRTNLRLFDANAVAKLEQAVLAAPTLTDEAASKLDLAGAYLLFSSEPLKGITLLKEVADNTQYTGAMRSRAVLKMLYIFIVSSMDLDIAKNSIFTGSELWSGFAKNSRDMEEAARKAYEWTLQYGEWPSAKYYIASWYGMRLLEAKNTKIPLDHAREKEYRTQFDFFREAGDAWLPNLLVSASNESYEKVAILGKHADLYTLAYMLDGRAEDRKEAVRSFGQALEMIDNFKGIYSDIYADSARRAVQFDYAKLLAYDAISGGGRDAEPKIHELLSPIVNSDRRAVIRKYIKNIGLLDAHHPLRRQITNIAEADPDFRNFLEELGWMFSKP